MCRGLSVSGMQSAIRAALDTLPDAADQAAFVTATSQLNTWRYLVHSEPFTCLASHAFLDSIVDRIRLTCVSAYVSHLPARQ